MGNNGSTIDIREGRFALNLRFVIEQLYRVTAPGCNCCIHIQQLLAYKVQHGFMGRRDFRGAVIDCFRSAGWQFKGEVAVPKDPQVMAQRLNLHSLQFKTGYARSATDWAPAPNDYVLIFQKPGEVEHPVRPLKHKTNPGGWMTQEDWILWARGVWEIDQLDVLDTARSRKAMNALKDAEEERHVCPLQLELIRRLVRMYSNPASLQPGVCVLDPFAGIGSVPVVAVQEGRNALGFELKESYHAQAMRNVRQAMDVREKTRERGLFDGAEGGAA